MANPSSTQPGAQDSTPTDSQSNAKSFTQEQLEALIQDAVKKETQGLKVKNDELIGEKRDAAKKAQEAEIERQRIAEEAAKKAGDVNALEKSWTNKLEALEADNKQEIAALLAAVEGLTIGKIANEIANRLAIDSDAAVNISDYVRMRLRLDEKHSVKVLDGEGKPSALSLKELEQQVSDLPRFKHVIKNSNASGGGAAGASGGAGSSLNRSKMSAEDKRQYQIKHGQVAFLNLPK